MATASLASATIRKLQHDAHTRGRSSSSGPLGDTGLKAEGNGVGNSEPNAHVRNGVDRHSASSSSSTNETAVVTSVELSKDKFCPVDSSTPSKRSSSRNNDGQRTPNSSTSSSTIDTESTDSPHVGETPHISGPYATMSSQVPSFKAPIVGYEILEERVKFTVFKINVQHIPTRQSWFVFRRYTDFARLFKKVRSLFPHWKLCLPPKRWFRNNFDPSFLEGRLEGLRNLVDDLLSHSEVYSCNDVRDFFCFDDPPGPHDTLEESRLQCETLEGQVNALRLELDEKQAEIDVVKAELTLVKAQRESLLNSLSRECSIVSMVNGSDKSLDDVPSLRRTHLINVSVVHMMQRASSANDHMKSNGNNNTKVSAGTNMQRISANKPPCNKEHVDNDNENQQSQLLDNSEFCTNVANGSEELKEYVTCVSDSTESYCNGIQQFPDISWSHVRTIGISDGVKHRPEDDHSYDNDDDDGGGGGGGSIISQDRSTKAEPSMDDNGNQTFGKVLDTSGTIWRD